jgi:hypothetical protein
LRATKLALVAHAEGAAERFLGNAYRTIFPHSLLALFLLLQKLALAGRLAAVAFGGDVPPLGYFFRFFRAA